MVDPSNKLREEISLSIASELWGRGGKKISLSNPARNGGKCKQTSKRNAIQSFGLFQIRVPETKRELKKPVRWYQGASSPTGMILTALSSATHHSNKTNLNYTRMLSPNPGSLLRTPSTKLQRLSHTVQRFELATRAGGKEKGNNNAVTTSTRRVEFECTSSAEV